MKWFGWPRPPLVLGFIPGPVIESNLWPAMQIWGVLGILSRPVTLALAIFGVASALYLTWMMGSVSEVEKKCLKLMLRAPTARQKTHREARADDPSSLSGTTKFFSPGLLLASIWAMRETQNFAAAQSRFLPAWLLIFMIPASGFADRASIVGLGRGGPSHGSGNAYG